MLAEADENVMLAVHGPECIGGALEVVKPMASKQITREPLIADEEQAAPEFRDSLTNARARRAVRRHSEVYRREDGPLKVSGSRLVEADVEVCRDNERGEEERAW